MSIGNGRGHNQVHSGEAEYDIARKPWGRRWLMERVKGIEPSYAAWEAAVLPLNYTRKVCRFYDRFLYSNNITFRQPGNFPRQLLEISPQRQRDISLVISVNDNIGLIFYQTDLRTQNPVCCIPINQSDCQISLAVISNN
jgi:hypothetical protein